MLGRLARFQMLLGGKVPAEFQTGGEIEIAVLRAFEAIGRQERDAARRFIAPALANASRCGALKPYFAPPSFAGSVSALALVGDGIPPGRQMTFVLSAFEGLHGRIQGDAWLKLPVECQGALLQEAVCRELLSDPLCHDRRRVASYQDAACTTMSIVLSEFTAQRHMRKLIQKFGGYPRDKATMEAFDRELAVMPREFPSQAELGIEYGGIGSKVEAQGYKFL